MKGHPYEQGFDVREANDKLHEPLNWKKPRIVFVNSMSDIFHEDISTSYIMKIFETMNDAHQHTFQMLTKRPERMVQLAHDINWTKNIWMGVSVENNDNLTRVDLLQEISSAICFIGFEPLLGKIINFQPFNINWIIVSGESGPNAWPMNIGWVRIIRECCIKYSIPFFFKHLGGKLRKRGSKEALLDGRLWHQYPDFL